MYGVATPSPLSGQFLVLNWSITAKTSISRKGLLNGRRNEVSRKEAVVVSFSLKQVCKLSVKQHTAEHHASKGKILEILGTQENEDMSDGEIMHLRLVYIVFLFAKAVLYFYVRN